MVSRVQRNMNESVALGVVLQMIELQWWINRLRRTRLIPGERDRSIEAVIEALQDEIPADAADRRPSDVRMDRVWNRLAITTIEKPLLPERHVGYDLGDRVLGPLWLAGRNFRREASKRRLRREVRMRAAKNRTIVHHGFDVQRAAAVSSAVLISRRRVWTRRALAGPILSS